MKRAFLALLIVGGLIQVAFGQIGYRLPPKEVVDIIDARPEPSVNFSPDGNWMLLIERDAMPTVADISRRMLQLAGLRIDPAANGPFQLNYNRGVTVRSRDGAKSTRVPLAADAKISGFRWSHKSDRFVFSQVTDKG